MTWGLWSNWRSLFHKSSKKSIVQDPLHHRHILQHVITCMNTTSCAWWFTFLVGMNLIHLVGCIKQNDFFVSIEYHKLSKLKLHISILKGKPFMVWLDWSKSWNIHLGSICGMSYFTIWPLCIWRRQQWISQDLTNFFHQRISKPIWALDQSFLRFV